MRITIRQDDQPEVEVDVDVTLSDLTVQEAARLEEELGPDRFDRLIDEDPRMVRSPSVLRALIWTKVVTHVPGVAIDEFDLDMGQMAGFVQEEDPGLPEGTVIPIDIEGETVDVEVESAGKAFGGG